MITKRYRLALPPQILTVAAVPIFFGIYATVRQGYDDGWWIALLGLIPFCFISGTQVDINQRRVRTFVEFWGLKIGKWFTFEEFPEMVMLSNQRSFNLASTARSGISFNSGDGKGAGFSSYMMYELYLMDRSHEARIMVSYLENKEKAEAVAKDLSSSTGLPWVSYSPGGRFKKKRLDKEAL